MWRTGITISITGVLALFVLFLLGIDTRRGPAMSELQAIDGLARLHCDSGEYDAAIELYAGALREWGSVPFLELGQAAAFFRAGRFRDAERRYEALREDDPDSPIVLYNLALVLVRQDRAAEADPLLRRFVDLYGDSIPALAEKARHMLGETDAPPH